MMLFSRHLESFHLLYICTSIAVVALFIDFPLLLYYKICSCQILIRFYVESSCINAGPDGSNRKGFKSHELNYVMCLVPFQTLTFIICFDLSSWIILWSGNHIHVLYCISLYCNKQNLNSFRRLSFSCEYYYGRINRDGKKLVFHKCIILTIRIPFLRLDTLDLYYEVVNELITLF